MNLIFDLDPYADINSALLFKVRFRGSGLRVKGEFFPLIRVPVTAAGGKIAFINYM